MESSTRNKTLCDNYKPLSHKRMIRILHLSPGTENTPLEGLLEEATLEDHAEYEALSYVWGDPTKVCRIFLKGMGALRITRSLFNALKDLRPVDVSSVPRVVWADAICIDQDNIEERQHQVSIMSSIYRAAWRVITYIGPESEDSTLAIEFARQLFQFAHSDVESFVDPRLHQPSQVHLLGLPRIDDPCWRALKRLLLRGWPSRCWCAHEFLMNKELTMMCGRHEFSDWDLLATIMELVMYRKLPVFLAPTNTEDPESLRECLIALGRLRKRTIVSNASLPLLTLLDTAHSLKASDPRDKIYAILGLSNDKDRYAITIDYSCAAASLYTLVAARCITVTQSLDILYSNLLRKNIDLPSWVPDWSTWRYGGHGYRLRLGYNACGKTKPTVEVDSSGMRLSVAAGIVDVITWLDNNTVGSYYNDVIDPRRFDWLVDMTKRVERLDQYRQNCDDVLCKTLVANFMTTDDLAAEKIQEAYESHLKLTNDTPATQLAYARSYVDAARRRSRYRLLCTTKRDYFAAVPETAQPGDCIAMLEGGQCLFVVRPTGDDFILVGTAYVHGLMHGEVIELGLYTSSTLTFI